MTNKNLLLLFTVVASLLFTLESSACKCPRTSPAEKYKEADVVITGQPLKMEGAHSAIFGKFQIEKNWKGKATGSDLFYQAINSECGTRIIDNGTKYLVYAKKGEMGWKMNLCASLALDKAQEDLSYLSSLKK